MPLTSDSDIFASVSENLFAALVENLTRQRPSLFNYGTQTFVNAPSLMCVPITVAPGLPGNQPLVTLEQPIPVPGTGNWAFEWCAQLTKLGIDLHPGNLVPLPPELGQLPEQSIALRAAFCAAIGCPSERILGVLGMREASRYPALDPAAAIRGESKQQTLPEGPMQTLPLDRERIHCFCLELYAIARRVIDQSPEGPVLRFELVGVEIVDIRPEGLEQSLECLIGATLALGVLPRFRLALKDLLLDLAEYGQLTIGLTPTSANVPNNPSIAQDRLSVWVDVA